MSKFLEMIQTEAKPKKQAMLFYGEPGCGKTSLAAQFPDVLFVIDPMEDGINTLKLSGQVPNNTPVLPLSTWEEVEQFVDELAETKDVPYKHLAFDCLGGFERLLHDYVCKVEYNGVWGEKGFNAFQKGYEKSVAYLSTFLNKLDRLKAKGIGPLFLAHTHIKPFNDPQRPSYDKIIVDVHHKTYAAIKKWIDVIGFFEFVILTEEEGNRTKAKGGQYRQMHLSNSGAFDAKNRNGITKPVPMGKSGKEGFQNLMNAFKQDKQETK